MMASALAWTAGYEQQAEVTNWPARIVLIVVVLVLIGLALWGMRRGWVNRMKRQDWIAEPPAGPVSSAGLGQPVAGLFLGTATAGHWMDRIVVFDLGVRSRCALSWGPGGIWFERTGARDLFVGSGDVVGIRVDRGIAGTVRAKDSVIVVTWRLGDAVLDTGFRADDTPGHGTVLDGLAAEFGVVAGSQDYADRRPQGQENGESALG